MDIDLIISNMDKYLEDNTNEFERAKEDLDNRTVRCLYSSLLVEKAKWDDLIRRMG